MADTFPQDPTATPGLSAGSPGPLPASDPVWNGRDLLEMAASSAWAWFC